MDLHFTMSGREVRFSMHYDETFAADRNMLHCLQQLNACEPEVMHLMARVLREGDFAVDVGANVGFFTLFMSLLVGATGKVLACEPGPNNQRKLEANIALNKMLNVKTFYSPLWSKDNEAVTLYLAEDSGDNSLCPNAATTGAAKKRSMTLDTLLVAVPRLVAAPRLLKLDVEGAEHHVLQGLSKRVPFIVCEMNEPALTRFDSSRAKVRKHMANCGYDTFLLPADGILPVLVPRRTQLVSQKSNLNVLFSTIDAVAEVYPEVTYG